MLMVRHGGQFVGSLQAVQRELTFRYDIEWLGRPHTFPRPAQLYEALRAKAQGEPAQP